MASMSIVAWDGEVGDVRINAAAAVNVILNYDEQVKPDVAPTSALASSARRSNGVVAAIWV